ncbi:hypothetical protein [Natrarchaeobius oligotrophus]|uniref:Uncharacterized protein n=1 Tax=Natrarchaeobius chitinivorans TaxID=1679083 RepID=A0A3N6PLV9_NATCH|nr:hypothetical protein [Natrarchaeobius chitinivorans]RQH02510.1 hypothetical protein EA472_04195 [Natrarchaeobius chitinivorans]
MSHSPRLSRRAALRIGACIASGTIVAGCTEDAANDPDDMETDEPIDEIADDAEPADAGWEDGWEDVDAIELEAADGGDWVGRRPAAIDGVENPDLELYEGREYEFAWVNRDGDVHNLAIWDESDPLISTDFEDDDGERSAIIAEATAEMELYLCETHGTEMAGAIDVRTQ